MTKYGEAREATDDNITQGMRFACWLTEVTKRTFRIRNAYSFSTATMVSLTRLMLRYTYIACLVKRL